MSDILFLAHRVPFPPDRGDKIRASNILTYLAARRRVHLVAFADDRRDLTRSDPLDASLGSRSVVWRAKPDWLAALQAVCRREPVSLAAFRHAALRAAVDTVLRRHAIDTIYVFSSQMAQYLPRTGGPRVVMDFCDVDSAKFAQYGRTTGGLRGWMMRREARLLLAHDRAVAQRAGASVFISPAEATLFAELTGVEPLHVVENGIDTATFDPAAPFVRVVPTGDLIVFTGQMDYAPNIAAVRWFAEAILPQVRARHPAARFAIVGRNPTGAVQALAKLPGVAVIGEVPDVRGWLAAAAVVVAPLQLARGVQNKVLEAMAMARPLVASAAAAQGIDHAGTIRVGATGEAIAAAILELLADPAGAAALGAAARARVIARYGWAARLAPLDDLVEPSRQPHGRHGGLGATATPLLGREGSGVIDPIGRSR